MLGREPIIDRERTCLRGSRNPRDHRAMGRDGTHHVSASMEVENDTIGCRSRWHYPFGPDAIHRDRLASHIASNVFADTLHPGAHLLDGCIRIARSGFQYLEHLV